MHARRGPQPLVHYVAPVIAAGDGAHFTASGKPSSSIRYRTTTRSADIRRQVDFATNALNRPLRGTLRLYPIRCENFRRITQYYRKYVCNERREATGNGLMAGTAARNGLDCCAAHRAATSCHVVSSQVLWRERLYGSGVTSPW